MPLRQPRPTPLALSIYLAALSGAMAQTAAPAVEEIAVTGTRIRGVEAVGSNAVAISAKDIAQTGLVTSTDLLRSVPQVSNIGADDSRTSGAQRAVSNIFAGSAVNLRGLGVEATLGLLDGKRPIRGGEARFFNMDNIPAMALRRVEVVPDGASAIYGSDAVTGVVNLVPFHTYDGIAVRANYGSANGLKEHTFGALGGKSWDSGSVVAAYENHKRGNLQASARPSLYDDSLNTAGAIGTSTNSSPGNLRVGAAIRPIIDSNNDGRLSAAEYAASLASATPNRQSNWLGADALPRQERDSVFAYAEQDLTEKLRRYAEGFYSRRDFFRLNAAQTSTLTVPASNFYNQSGVAAPLSVLYSFINDLGPTQISGSETSRQVTAGLKFDFAKGWQAEAYYSDGHTTGDQRANQQINNAALTAALGNSTAAAFSAFSNGRVTQQATLDSISGYSANHNVLGLKNGAVKLDGSLFALPGGEVRFAAGAEKLQETRAALTASTASGADVNTLIVANQATVTRKVNSAYAELLVPIIGPGNAMPGIQRLSLSLADRYDAYEDSVPGSKLLDTHTSNPKLGITWQPASDMKVRGSYGTSFRAPSLGDYSYGAPTFQAAASAAAVPHAAGLFGLPNGPVAAVLIQGGRLDGVLKPEKAKTWSLGLDFTPSSVPGLNLAATYYEIEYKNQIGTPATSAAFTDASYANALVAAGLAIANPTTAQVQQFLAFGGALTPHIGPPAVVLYGSGSSPVGPQNTPIYLLIDSRSVNSGVVKTSGWDFSAKYNLKTSVGNWTFADTFTYVSKFRQSLLTGSPLVGYLNTYGYPLRFSTRAQVGWEKDGASANAFVNYANAYSNTQVTPNLEISAYTTLDLTLGYDMGSRPGSVALDNLSFQLSVRNLFDRKPPDALVGNPAQAFDTQNASAIGRMFAINVQKKW